MLLDEVAAARRVLFVGGKGGVGKTAVASATALAQARAGRRVLLVSTDPAHSLGHLWGRSLGDGVSTLVAPSALTPTGQTDQTASPGSPASPPSGRPTTAGGLDGLEIDPVATVDAHLKAVRGPLRRLMPEHLAGEVDKHLELARDSPGMHESAVLDRLAEVLDARADDYDLVIVDTAPSGHTVRLLSLPGTLAAWTDGLLRRREKSERLSAAVRGLESGRDPDPRAGRDRQIREVLQRRREKLAGLRAVLTDARVCAFVIVTAAERLPVMETIELYGHLRGAGIAVPTAVVNKRSPVDAGDFLARRHSQEEEHLQHLRTALPDLPLLQAPLLTRDVTGSQGVERLWASMVEL